MRKEQFGTVPTEVLKFDSAVSLITPRVHNYYHFLVDFLPRLLYSVQGLRNGHIDRNAVFIFPSREQYSHTWDVLDMLGINLLQRRVSFTRDPGLLFALALQ